MALAAGLFPALMVFFQVRGFNGPYYWRWGYGHDSIVPFLLLLAPAGFVVWWAQRRLEASAGGSRAAVGLLVVAQAFLLFSYIGLSEHSFDTVPRRIRNPDITSYYSEALAIHDLRHWAGHYDAMLPRMHGHAQTHPPGPILYFYLWIKLLGDPAAAAFWAGIFLGLLACLATPAIYALVRRLTEDPEAAFLSAAVWAVLPGIIVIFPSLDQVYPALTILLLWSWEIAVGDGGRRYAILFGTILFGALLFTHSFLVLGTYFVIRAVFARRKAMAAGAVGALTAGGLFAAAYWLTGYNHTAALQQSVRIQQGLARVWARPYHLAVFWDLYDFFLASGWISAGILVLAALRWKIEWKMLKPGVRAFLPAALGCLMIVDLSGLLRTEAARVWLFLQPLAVVLVGWELARWSRAWQWAAYGTLLFVLAVIRSRLNFL